MAPTPPPLVIHGHEMPSAPSAPPARPTDSASTAAPEGAALSMASDARDTDYIIIQTRASLTSQEKDELNQADVQVLELLSLNTYLCRYLPQDLQVLRQKSYIAHVDVYHSHLKIHADIQRHAPALRVSPVSLLSATSAIGSSSSNAYEEVHLSIGFHNSDDSIASETLRELVEKQLVDPSRTPLDGNRIDTAVPSSSIPSLLKIDAIKIIEPTSTLELRNDHARNVLAADTILNNTIFRGTNQIIALGDTGFDVGVTASTGTRNLHPAFTGRVLKAYNAYNLKHNLNNTNPADVEDTNGHGTHCAGSAVGADIPGLNGGQNVKLRGTAPGAQLIAYRVFDNIGSSEEWRNGNPHPLLSVPYDLGARVFSQSWGTRFEEAKGQQLYDLDSGAIDKFVYDFPQALICWAAGNDGTKPGPQIDSQAVAKNILVVGNCYSSRPAEERVDGLNKPGAQSGDHFAMAASSTFGPPKSPDGMKVDRIKPDVVAPGINILSTCSGAREKVKDGDAAGLEKRAKGKYVDERYYYSNGTSMATPLVAGCVAVLRQALVEMSGVKEPSAALLKALIVNGAVPLEKNKGVFDPQFKWGFGRVNLAASIAHLDDPTKKKMVGFQTRMIKVLEGTPYLFTELTVPPAPFSDDALADAKNSVSKRRLRVTLAWTDFPSPLLQHRLYLSVQSEGKSGKLIRLGNRKGELTDKPDEANNVQKVDLVDIPPGPARILVHYEASETWVGKQEVDADVAWFIE